MTQLLDRESYWINEFSCRWTNGYNCPKKRTQDHLNRDSIDFWNYFVISRKKIKWWA